ncbi:MAG: SRPBCC family protein [Chitinophagaceae bacterium]
MSNKLTAKASININVPVSKAWKALTDPAMIKEYLFGTDTKTDWKKGSSIIYSGVWEGKSYEDKGVIVDIVPEKLLHTTYFSAMSGKEDKPENYANVIYKVSPDDGHSIITITQDNIDDEKQLNHMEENWGKVLEGMKKLLEN